MRPVNAKSKSIAKNNCDFRFHTASLLCPFAIILTENSHFDKGASNRYGDRLNLGDRLFLSDSQVVIKGLECEEGECKKHTPPIYCHARHGYAETCCNAPMPCKHNPPSD